MTDDTPKQGTEELHGEAKIAAEAAQATAAAESPAADTGSEAETVPTNPEPESESGG